MRAPLLLALGLLAAACARTIVPLDVAEQQCANEALRVTGPRTTGGISLGMGAGSGGFSSTDLAIGISTDLSGAPRDPEAFYASCVLRRSGHPPSRPLFDRG